MRSLYVRIWLTVVAALALFALVSGWLVRQHLERERERAEVVLRERLEAWGDFVQQSLPPPGADAEAQRAALEQWSQRLRVPLALDDADGVRIAASQSWLRRGGDQARPERLRAIPLDDGRTLWLPRRPVERALRAQGPPPWHTPPPGAWPGSRPWPEGLGLVALLALLFAAVAAGAWPVVRRLTRRLEALKAGVEAFGAGALDRRVPEDGRDEVAAVAASFNRAAARIEHLVRSHQSLLANASHELRSPLARLKMALAMLDGAPAAERARLAREIDTNIAELDALVEEVLLSSRLDAAAHQLAREPVALLALAAEEAARVGAVAGGDDVELTGDERLLRRALRNLLENARRYAGDDITVQVLRRAGGGAELRVADRGLGLALVRQIAERHGGRVRCEPRADEGSAPGGRGGSVFVISLPAAPPVPPVPSPPPPSAAAPPSSPR